MKNIPFENAIPRMSIEELKHEYPKDAIEHIVDQIIKLKKSIDHDYCHEVNESIKILNHYLTLMSKPYLILKDDKK